MHESAQVKLDKIAQEIIDSNICADLKSQATQLVMGHGNLEADMVIIGEAPGADEDEQGIPFVGAAGKFLNTMLESVGINREDVYITNIVKYRPPKNRDPRKSEKAEFAPFLERELEIIKPKTIITLGAHSLNHFMPNSKIGDTHGKVMNITLGGRPVALASSYHPSYAAYGNNRQLLLDDFKQIADKIKLY